MATRHELIHIDFVANAGKANPVLKSLQVSCEDARLAKEKLDKQLSDARAANAPAKVISDLETQLKAQTTTWRQLEKGVREYAKGIDTLSKGIKEFNAGTLDEMSAKFNKSVYNAAKLAQSAVKTGSSEWNQLQRLMDATDRNVVRAREDIDVMMQSLKDGSSVSTVQLTRARDVLQDLARLAVTNSDEWRSLQSQMNQVTAAVNTVSETEKRLKGEITTVDDAMALSNALTKESIALRHADGEAAMQAARKEREGVEATMNNLQQQIAQRSKKRDDLKAEIELQESITDLEKKRDAKISEATGKRTEAEQRRATADIIIKQFEDQKQKVAELKKEKEDLEKQEKQSSKAAKEAADSAEKQKQVIEQTSGAVNKLEGDIKELDAQIEKLNSKPVKVKVDKKEEVAATDELTEATEKNTRSKKKNNEAKQKAVELSEKEIEQYREKVGKIQDELQDLRAEQVDKENDIRLIEQEEKKYQSLAKSIDKVREAFSKVQGAETLHVTDDELTIQNAMRSKYVQADNDTFQRSVQYMQESLKGFASPDALKEKYKDFESYLKELKFNLDQVSGALEYADKRMRKGDATIPEDELRSRMKVLEDLKKAYHELYKTVEANGKAYFEAGEKTGAEDLAQKKKELQAIKDKIAVKEEEIKQIMASLGIQPQEIQAIDNDTKATEKNNTAKKESIRLTKKQKEEIGLLETAIKGQSSEIEKLKKQRDALNASGTVSSRVTAKTPEEAAAAKEAMTARSDIHVSTKGVASFSNIEEAQLTLQKLIKKANDLAVATDGSLQLTNKHQVDTVIQKFQEAYGLQGERKEAINIIKQLISGDKGGLFASGTMDEKMLRIIPDKEAVAARVDTLKQLFAIINGTTKATEEKTKADKENIDVEKQKKDLDEKIAKLEQEQAENQAKINEIKEKGTSTTKKSVKAKKEEAQATEEQTKADEESISVEQQKAELLAKREKLASDLAKKQDELAKLQEKLNTAEREGVKETGNLAAKTEEYNSAVEKLGTMKEGRDQAVKDRSNASRVISRQDENIATLQRETYTRLPDEEVEKMRQRAKELKGDIDNLTTAFNDNAQSIARLNKTETDAAIEMAQSENVSIEKVKQAIEVLQRKIQTEATDEETMKARGEAINRLKDRLTEMNAEVARLSKPIADTLSGDLGKMSETQIRQGIDAAKELVKTYETGSTEAKTLTDNIVRAENHLKEHSVEAARQAQKEKDQLDLMTARMSSLGNLSNSAFDETKRFWQAMYDGADKNDPKLKEIEERLKNINAEEKRRSAEQAEKVIGDMGSFSDAEISAAVKSFEQLRDAQTHGNEEWKRFNELAQQGKTHLEEIAKADALAKMGERMQNLTTLSDSAFSETKKFWEAMKAGAEQGSDELKIAEDNLKRITELEKERAKAADEEAAKKISGEPHLFLMSEKEIQTAIDATKRLQKEVEYGGDEYDEYSKAILNAEDHLKKYGIEAERAARKQKESNVIYERQLYSGEKLSTSALKAQEQYWQRLIDDPKTASEALAHYETNLRRTHKLQQQMAEEEVKTKGETALSWFQNGGDANASANKIKDMAADLKAYRDSLPKESEAAKIAEINDYLEQSGVAAKKAAADVMELDEALEIAEGAGKDGFLASPQQIQAATKAINERRDAVIKLIQDNKRLGASTDTEEAELEDLTKKLRDLKFEQDNFNMSQAKMQSLMETPTNAVNLEELRAAIKRADGELKRMEGSLGENSQEYQAFAEQVKNAKNVLKEMEGQAKATATAWDKAWSRLKTYVGMYMGFNMLWGKVTGTFDDLMTLSDKMGEVQKTTNLSADAVGKLSRNLAGLDVRTPLSELMAISASAGQLGLKTEEDIMGFTEAANKMMIALPEMGKEATTEMMRVAIATGEVEKIGKEMRQGLVEGSSEYAVAMEKIASTIDRLRANSASTAPEITDFVKRVGAVGAQSGITIDQVAALGSTVSSLGMRVEMSATALSRMIPAIKNNAFAVAKAIGVTPDTLRDLFEAGRGMEAILMIFQKIKDSNMDADSIEKLLGMGGMQQIMKELNQQGARAGIVFAGLSQNVDELRKQLVTANEAYVENTAIQQEFDRMNDTTAAKLERLKNRVQEMFVGDTMQRLAGGLISALDALAKMIADNGPVASGVKALGVAFLALKVGVGEAMKALWLWLAELGTSITKAGTAMKSISSANWWGALATVIVYLGVKIYDWATSIDVVANEMAKLDQEIKKQTDSVDKLFHAVTKSNVVLEAARNKLEEVAKAGGDATEAENALKKANTEHAATIREINSKYGSYLGYMLSETSSAEQLARARELINAKLRETITLKQQEAALGNVEQEFGGKVNKKGAAMESTINTFFGKNYEAAARVSVAINEAAQKYSKNSEQFEKEVRKIVNANFVANGQRTKQHNKNALANMKDRILSDAEDYREAIEEYAKQETAVNNRFEARRRESRKTTRTAVAKDLNAILADWKTLVDDYRKAEGKEKERLAVEVYKQQRSYANAIANNADYLTDDKRKAVYDANIKKMATYEKGLRKVAGEAIRTVDAMERAETKITGTDFTNGGESSNNPWGKALEAESTDWKNMTAEQLVARRKQMKDFVNAIQTDTDVQAVLKEDAALKKAIEKGMSSDMRTVIEWYNTERLKIQDELHARHLTNTGDWMDPKKQAARKKQFTDEMKAYLEELDAYYTERNQKIQNARNDEEITEGEAWRQTIENESEWHQRRAELQKMYSNKSAEVVKDEQEAIHKIIAKRTGDDVAYIEKSMQKTKQFAEQVRKADPRGEDEYRKWQADLGLGWEKDFMKQAKTIGKQVKFMTDTLAKERPFNGITENLELNLTKMGIMVGNVPEKMHFLLGQIEDAYTLDVKQMVDRVAQAGFTEWAKQLQGDVSMQQAMLAQLRTAYEAVQEAIRKEGARIKKDADMMWKLALTPDGKNLKQEIDAALVNMTQQQEAVSRANSLIGAGSASENVASRVAIKQMQLQLSVQQAQFALMRKMGDEKAQYLDQLAEQYEKENKLKEAERARLDAENVRKSLDIAITEEKKKQAEITKQIAKEQEEIQNRLYKDLRDLAGLFSKGLQGVFEAVNFYNSSDYNQLAVTRAGGSYNKKTTKTTSYSTSSKVTDTGKHSTSSSASSTSTKTNKTDSSDASQASKTSYSDTNRDQSVNRSATSDTHSTTNTSQSKTSTTTTEKIQSYYIIDNAGTKDAVAREVEMSEEEYYEKKIELDRDNAIKEAWKNLLDELNMKMSETITDQINAMFQDAAVNANTDAAKLNTDALKLNTEAQGRLTEALNGLAAAKAAEKTYDFSGAYKVGGTGVLGTGDMGLDEEGVPNALKVPEGEGSTSLPKMPWQMTEEEMEAAKGQAEGYFQFAGEKMIETNEMLNEAGVKPFTPQVMTDEEMETVKTQAEEYNISVADTLRAIKEEMAEEGIESINPKILSDEEMQAINDQVVQMSQVKMDAQNAVAANKVKTDKQMSTSETQTGKQMTASSQAAYAKMTAALNMYGIAYQTMSNDNLSATQKFQMFAVQAAGNAAISTLTATMAESVGGTAALAPKWMSKFFADLGPWAYPVIGATTALLGTMMGLATSKISKSKQEIAQATGASASATSVSAGKLMTGMLTYGEGNVNEFTDPNSLQQGRYYNVDSNDGRTYRARYMGTDPKTHITNGPEFHLVGERGREAIIDAGTTRNIQLNEPEIWNAIQTIYNGGTLRHSVMRRKGRGMAAFADGNLDEMYDGEGMMADGTGVSPEQMAAFTAALDRNNELWERVLDEGIEAFVSPYGPRGIVNGYDTAKKEALSHGEKYL